MAQFHMGIRTHHGIDIEKASNQNYSHNPDLTLMEFMTHQLPQFISGAEAPTLLGGVGVVMFCDPVSTPSMFNNSTRRTVGFSNVFFFIYIGIWPSNGRLKTAQKYTFLSKQPNNHLLFLHLRQYHTPYML